jgi:protein-S-isoprenylcysteine O-methyltransferase Ste14
MAPDAVFRLLQALILVGFVANRAYYNRRLPAAEQETLEKQEQRGLGRLAELLALPALLGTAAYVANPAWMDWSAVNWPAWARWAGVGLALAGFALLRWSHQALGENWSDRPRITQGQQLVTEGPYRRIRHPIYTAFLLILGSSLFVSANWFIGALWLAMTGLDVRSRIAFEEDRMLARFGDEYRSYKARTSSLIPWI